MIIQDLEQKTLPLDCLLRHDRSQNVNLPREPKGTNSTQNSKKSKLFHSSHQSRLSIELIYTTKLEEVTSESNLLQKNLNQIYKSIKESSSLEVTKILPSNSTENS